MAQHLAMAAQGGALLAAALALSAGVVGLVRGLGRVLDQHGTQRYREAVFAVAQTMGRAQ